MEKTRATVRFEWKLNVKGYQWAADGTVLQDSQATPFDLRATQPLEKEPGLFRTFAGLNGKDTKALRGFANRFGLLRSDSAGSEPLRDWEEVIGQMHCAVSAWDTLTRVQKGEPFTEDPKAVHQRLVHALDAPLKQVSMGMVANDDGSSAIAYTPRDLLSALWLQFAIAVTEGKDLQPCERKGCDRWMEITHSKGGTRSTRRFCSHACRMRFVRDEKKKEES